MFAGVGTAQAVTSRANATMRRCDRSESEGNGQIFDLTGAIKVNRKNGKLLITKFIFIMQF